jgi:hypothetical protein
MMKQAAMVLERPFRWVWHAVDVTTVTETSALKSGPVSVLLPFLEGPQTGPVPESFRIQEPRTGTAKNRKKPVQTGCNQSRKEYNKPRARSAKIGHGL